MFKSIKLRIMKGRQLKPFATAKVLQEHEDRLTALEEGNSGEESDSSSDTPLEDEEIYTVTVNLTNLEAEPSSLVVGLFDNENDSEPHFSGRVTNEMVTFNGVTAGEYYIIGAYKTANPSTPQKITVDKDHTTFTHDMSARTKVSVDISVKVEDENSNPVNQAQVELWAEIPSEGDEPIATGTTGSAGGCTLKNIEEGEYYLTATAIINDENYTARPMLTVVTNKGDTEFTLEVQKAV